MLRRSLILAVTLAATAEAAPRDFSFTFDSQTLEQGKAETFFELTPRAGRRDYYARFDTHAGAVLGLADVLETHVLLETAFDFSGQPPQIGGWGRLTNLLRYHFLRRGDPLGFALQLRLSLGFDDLALGGRFIVDYRTASLRLAFNAAFDRTLFFRGQTGVSMRAEENVALGYALKSSLTPALEISAQQSMSDEKFEGSAFFFGGSLSYRQSWGWFSLGMLVQAAAVKPEADVGDGEKLELRDHERFLWRFAIGVNAL